jgi:hypothetical protein
MGDRMISGNINGNSALLKVARTRKQRRQTSRNMIPALTLRRNPSTMGPGSIHGRVNVFSGEFRRPRDLMARRSLTIETGKHAALIARDEMSVETVEQGEGLKTVELRNIRKRVLIKKTPELSILRMDKDVTGTQRTRIHRARLMHIRSVPSDATIDERGMRDNMNDNVWEDDQRRYTKNEMKTFRHKKCCQ